MGVFDVLSSETPLAHYGYQVVGHPNRAGFVDLERAFAGILRERLERFSNATIDTGFRAESYHATLDEHEIDHHAFIGEFKRDVSELLSHAHVQQTVERAAEIVGRPLRAYNDKVEFRVCRPGETDNNPWHRDHWFPYFTPLVNVYLPLSSSFVDSALQIVPFSHHWTEEDVEPTFRWDPNRKQKTSRGSVNYSVPEIASCRHQIVGHRPDVVPGDFMLFSPKMVHGAGSNTSRGTRFSLEFRLELAE